MEINRSALLPNLLTIGNGICGFAALSLLGKVQGIESELAADARNLAYAAYLVLLGMVFDVFDGKLARISRGGTELGAQLDSFCDLITFGLVPAYMVVRLSLGHPPGWQRVVWFFSLAYFLGALLRLARFNVENSPDESAHLAFKGLPTPAAAGCIASLVIFRHYMFRFEAIELKFFGGVIESLGLVSADNLKGALYDTVSYALPFLAPLLGFTMVADRLSYDHMGSKLFGRRQSFNFLAYLIFCLVLLAMVPEIVLPLAFLGYVSWTPLLKVYRYFVPGEEIPATDEPA